MLTSLKRPYAHIAVCPQPCRSHHQPMALLEIPEHSQASLGQSLVGSLLLSPGFRYTQGFVCALWSLFPLFCVSSVIRSHWPPKSNSLGVLSPFARSLGWEICCKVLGLSSQCENFCGIIVLQFVGRLLGSSMVRLMLTSSKRAYATGCVTRSPEPRAPAPAAGHC